MTRPTGVTVLAVLNFVGAALLFLGALLFLALGGALAQFSSMFGGLGAALAIFFAGFGILYVFLGRGLLQLKGWAWMTELILTALGGLGSLAGVANDAGNLFGVAIAGLVIWYLMRPHVRAAFGK